MSDDLATFKARLDELQATVARAARDCEARCLALADAMQRRQDRGDWGFPARVAPPPVGVSRPLMGVRVAQAPTTDADILRFDLKLAEMRREYGTARILTFLERLERADAETAGDLLFADSHHNVACALKVAREAAEEADARQREGK